MAKTKGLDLTLDTVKALADLTLKTVIGTKLVFPYRAIILKGHPWQYGFGSSALALMHWVPLFWPFASKRSWTFLFSHN